MDEHYDWYVVVEEDTILAFDDYSAGADEHPDVASAVAAGRERFGPDALIAISEEAAELVDDIDALGQVSVVDVDVLFGDDEDDFDDENTSIVRAKWSMDGAKTLGEAAAMLRGYADQLEHMEREGWQLTEPVEDDYGFIQRTAQPDGGSGSTPETGD